MQDSDYEKPLTPAEKEDERIRKINLAIRNYLIDVGGNKEVLGFELEPLSYDVNNHPKVDRIYILESEYKDEILVVDYQMMPENYLEIVNEDDQRIAFLGMQRIYFYFSIDGEMLLDFVFKEHANTESIKDIKEYLEILETGERKVINDRIPKIVIENKDVDFIKTQIKHDELSGVLPKSSWYEFLFSLFDHLNREDPGKFPPFSKYLNNDKPHSLQ